MVTIMGHVDHGKTTLLDYLRKSHVAANEAGGITQHIGAFSVKVGDDARITFLDTPGHAAFSSIRIRGAKVTDLIVLVVAAGDGVMAQTEEAIKLAMDNQVPMVVAINKCDMYGPEMVQKAKQSLMMAQVIPEDEGGDVQTVPISAVTGQGIPALLEAINAQAEIMELDCNEEAPVKAALIEVRTSKGQGEAAAVLVQEGQLKIGDILVGEESYCRVRSMTDSQGKSVVEAGPSEPVEVTGWKGTHPEAGVTLFQCASESDALRLIAERKRLREEMELLDSQKIAEEREKLDDKIWQIINSIEKNPAAAPRQVFYYDEVMTEQDPRPVLNLVVKCDVVGSLDAIQKVIREIPSKKARIVVVQAGIGPVTKTEVDLAKSANATIINFNQPVPKTIRHPVVNQKIIYHLVDDLKERLRQLLPPLWTETVLGKAKVLQLFPHDDTIVVGCGVLEGTLYKAFPNPGNPVHGLPPTEFITRIMRGNDVLKDQCRVRTMRHLKKEIPSAGKGMECGLLFEVLPEDIQPGDLVLSIQKTPSRNPID